MSENNARCSTCDARFYDDGTVTQCPQCGVWYPSMHVEEIRARLAKPRPVFCGCDYCINWLESACEHLLAVLDTVREGREVAL